MLKKPVQKIEKITGGIYKQADSYRKSTFKRFPTLFLGLSTLGLAATLHGFEQAVSSVPVFRDNPLLVFFLGVAVLVFTGTLYKKME